MKKRIISLILALCLMFSVLPLTAFADGDSPKKNELNELSAPTGSSSENPKANTIQWEYETYGGGIALTKYLGTSVDIYIPAKLEIDGSEYSVVKLGDSLFENNDTINSVTLGAGIIEIGDKAFYDADNLVCILISQELTTIGSEAFYSCDSFNSVILYDSVTAIGNDAFAECPKLTVWCNTGTAGYFYAVKNNIS